MIALLDAGVKGVQVNVQDCSCSFLHSLRCFSIVPISCSFASIVPAWVVIKMVFMDFVTRCSALEQSASSGELVDEALSQVDLPTAVKV